MALWKCSVCGYIHDGEDAPDKCPHCGAPKEKFEKLEAEKAELVEKSRETNDIHIEIASLLDQLMALAEIGMEINLDPRCYEIFKQAHDSALTIRQRQKAEIGIHISKGKWG